MTKKAHNNHTTHVSRGIGVKIKAQSQHITY